MKAVPCNIVSGFLGSGKTTLLKYVMENGLRNEPIAILMNEIGEVNIDGRVFEGLENIEKMVELTSGCICCTIQDYFLESAYMEILETAKPSSVIIECTGLADPGAILQRLYGMGVPCDSVITVVDAANYMRLADSEEVLERQVKEADFLVINKIDLVSQDELEALQRHLRGLNSRALMLSIEHGRADTEMLFASGFQALRHRQEASKIRDPAPDRHSHAHGVNEVQPLSYRTKSPVDLKAFRGFLNRLDPAVYRAKGLLKETGTGTIYIFNYTCGRFDITRMPALRDANLGTEVVFIGRGLKERGDPILAEFRGCER